MFKEIRVIGIISILLLSLCGIGSSESGTFENYAGMTEQFNVVVDAFYTEYSIHGIYFDEVEYYQDLQAIKITNIDQSKILNNYSVNSKSVPCIITNATTNVTVGEGNLGWGKVGTKYNIYLYLTSWNIGTDTGTIGYTVWLNVTQLGIGVKHWGSLSDIDQPEELGLTYGPGGAGRAVSAVGGSDQYYYVSHQYEFIHYWNTNSISDTIAFLNVTKIINDKAYNSSVTISSPLFGTYLDAISSFNESQVVSTTDIPIHLHIEDSLLDDYDVYIFGGGNDTLTGKALDISNHHIINNVSISSYINDNLYDIDTYNSPFAIVYPQVVNKLHFIKSGYTQKNETIDLTTQTDYTFYLVPIGIYTINTSTIYGNVFDYIDNTTISNAHITLFNATYSDNVYSDTYGYYNFYNLSIDNYNLSTYAFGYHPDDRIVNVTAINTTYLVDIYLSSVTAFITPTPHATSNIGLPIYEEEDIWGWIMSYWWIIILLVLILFMYRLYDKSGVRKIFK